MRAGTVKGFIKKHREFRPAIAICRAGHAWLRQARIFPYLVYERRRVRRFKDCHQDRRRCFLVGNGPSIRYQDLTRLRGEIVFVTNSFALHTQYEEIAPTYYCVSDPRVFVGGVNPEWGRLMKQKTQTTVKFFPLVAAKRTIRREGLFHGHPVYYLNYTGHNKIWELGTMSLDVVREVYTGDSVIIDFCLPLALYMGFSEIYLLGCDTDYGLDQAEDYSQGYFYDVKQVTSPRQTIDYHRQYWYRNVITSYEVARRLFEQHGCRIYNATTGGKLEVFPRVDFARLFE